MNKFIIFIFLIVAACSPFDECTNLSIENIYPSYPVHTNKITPLGIHVDDSYQNINLYTVDRIIMAVETCLENTFPTGYLTSDITDNGWCHNALQGKIRTLDRSCIRIKVPASYRLSCDATQQLLDRDAPQEGCESKNVKEKRNYKECPCSWRAGFQKDNIIVVTPDLHMLPDPLVKYLTSCSNVWIGELIKCLKPLTEPLTGEWINEEE